MRHRGAKQDANQKADHRELLGHLEYAVEKYRQAVLRHMLEEAVYEDDGERLILRVPFLQQNETASQSYGQLDSPRVPYQPQMSHRSIRLQQPPDLHHNIRIISSFPQLLLLLISCHNIRQLGILCHHSCLSHRSIPLLPINTKLQQLLTLSRISTRQTHISNNHSFLPAAISWISAPSEQ